MTADINISIEGKGDQVEVTVRFPDPSLPPSGASRRRAPFQLSAAWAELQSGVVAATQLDDVVDQLSSWLLSQGSWEALDRFLQQVPDESVRLVVSVDDRNGLVANLADLPLELMRAPGSTRPLGRHAKVGSIMYTPVDRAPPQETPPRRGLPVRVLLVRSNPKNLGGQVPTVEQVLGEQRFGIRGLFELDVLSRPDAGSIGLPVYSQLQAQTGRRPYDILVYLGHGKFDDAGKAVLALEDSDDDQYEEIDVDDLAAALGKSPPPVVLLVGCVTAAASELSALPEREREELWDRMRGSRNLAKELVRGETGVEVAVGMRYPLEVPAASEFLRAFFGSFLGDQGGQPGHVERALQAGREALSTRWPGLLTWSAPLAYRLRGTEPMFAGLAATVEEQRPDPGQATFSVVVENETDVTVETVEHAYGKDRRSGKVGDELLRDAVDVMEGWLRDGRFEQPRQFEVFGGLLFRLLFDREIEELFDRTYGRLTREQRLLLRLSFDDRAKSLRSLPWEYLYAPSSDRRPGSSLFFASYGKVSLVLSRFSSTAQSRPGDPVVPEAGKLRILVVLPPAPWLPEDHANQMREALKRLNEESIDVWFLPDDEHPDPVPFDVTEKIGEHRPHVVHFVGHGRLERETQEILLSGWRPSSDFVASLVNAPGWTPRLVFLQLTNWSEDNAKADFAQLAPDFIDQEVRAVVAMRYPITNRAAKAFCEVFYPALASGDMIDAAVQTGMRAMIGREARPSGDRLFGTPVFYIQSPSERVMQRAISPKEKPSSSGRQPDHRRRGRGGGSRDRDRDPGLEPSSSGVAAPPPHLQAARLTAMFDAAEETLDQLGLTDQERNGLAGELSRIRQELEAQAGPLRWRTMLHAEIAQAQDGRLQQALEAALQRAPRA